MARLNPDLLSGESLTYDLGPKLWALQTDLPLGFPRRGAIPVLQGALDHLDPCSSPPRRPPQWRRIAGGRVPKCPPVKNAGGQNGRFAPQILAIRIG